MLTGGTAVLDAGAVTGGPVVFKTIGQAENCGHLSEYLSLLCVRFKRGWSLFANYSCDTHMRSGSLRITTK